MSDDAHGPGGNAESLAAWSANAEFWDQTQGDDGNHWQRTLVFPATWELLRPQPAKLLELACGNGNFARAAAWRGVRVTATDGVEAQLERARGRTDADLAIDYRRVDVTDGDAITAIPGAPFDAAVCNMALMDIAEIEPLLEALPQVLRAGAPFVLSLLHPAFNPGPDTALYIERVETPEGRLATRRGVRIANYLQPQVQRGIAVVGQPSLQPYFHRPLQVLLGTAFVRGWVLDGIREPSLPPDEAEPTAERLRWDDLPDIPPVLVLRLRHLSGGADAS